MKNDAFKVAVLRALYIIMLAHLADGRFNLGMVLDWRKQTIKDGGPSLPSR